MSQFANSIPDELRQQLSVPPPPMYDRQTGELIPYAQDGSQRYADLLLVKEKNVVWIDEELDVYEHPGSRSHYRMMIRSMPWKADLEVILAAAKHLMLVGDYALEYRQREGIDPQMEHGFWDVCYTLPKEQYMADRDTKSWHEVSLPYEYRRRIWTGLFAALGHTRLHWGGNVLMVRSRKKF